MSIDSRFRAALALIALAAPLAAQSAAPAPAPATPAPAAAAPKSAPAAAAPGGVAAYEAPIIAAQKPSYPMNSCLACGKVWGPEDHPLDLVRQGRLVRVCGPDCVKPFDAQAAKWFKVLDDQIIAAQSSTYPLTHCPVTNEELGKKPKYTVVGTRLIEVCCNDCKKELATNPTTAAAAIAKIDAALVAAQGSSYPLDTCVVDGKPLAGTHVQTLYGVTLVRFCSDACQAKFLEAPRDYLPQLEAARKGQPAAPKPADAGR